MNEIRKPYFSSALWPGVVLGLLSVIPMIKYGNLFCCLWVVAGGVVAAVVFKQEYGSIKPGQGAFVGFIAGIIGAFVMAIGNGILWFFFHENYFAQINEYIGPSELDAETFDMIAALMNNPTLVVFVTLFGALLVNAVFATIGGLIAGAFMDKKARREGFSGDITPTGKE